MNNTTDHRAKRSITEHFIQQQQNTYSSQVHKQHSRTDHMLGHKTSLSKFKKIEIISSIFSNHNGIKSRL